MHVSTLLDVLFGTNIHYDWIQLIFAFIQISIATKIACTIAINCVNLMILISIERGKSDLSIHVLIANFAAFDKNLQANGKDILLMKSVYIIILLNII